MPQRTCSTEGCNRPHNAYGLCRLHRRRATTSAPRPRRLCEIPGCERVHYGHGFCVMHYSRQKVHGVPGEAAPRRNPRGAGHIHQTGYLVVTRHGHPLAHSNGHVFGHRLALYEAIGPGDHPCYWCGRVLSWASGDLTADHLDWDRLNNDPSNLVPSCLACNGQRRQEPMAVGEARSQAKLTEAQVLEIRRADGVTHRELAARYSVSESLIGQIRQRRIWKHVP